MSAYDWDWQADEARSAALFAPLPDDGPTPQETQFEPRPPCTERREDGAGCWRAAGHEGPHRPWRRALDPFSAPHPIGVHDLGAAS